MLCGGPVRDPYEVLGVERNATQTDIRGAFRRLASEHHPDRNPGDPNAQSRFTEINAAYQILNDEQKRAAFDRYGAAAFGSADGGVQDFVDLGSLGLDGLFGDLLGAFGIRTGDRGDMRQRLSLTFEEAVLGCTKDVTYARIDSCERCSGSGGEPGSRVERCAACGGRGRVRFQQGVLPLAIERPCSACKGRGTIPATNCAECVGRGLVKVTRTLEVTIPAGIEDGATRLIEGAGNRTRADKPSGDLELLVHVQPHPFFSRDGDDITCTVPVTFAMARRSAAKSRSRASRDGSACASRPRPQPGSVLRIRGRGAPHRYSRRPRRSTRHGQRRDPDESIPSSSTIDRGAGP